MATYYPSLLKTDGARSIWRLGETSGTTALDFTVRANHGTYVGASTPQAAGAILGGDGARSFSPAQGGYVSIPHSSTLNLTTGWGIECWVYLRSLPGTGQAPCFFTDEYPGPELCVQMALGFWYGAGSEGKVFVGFHAAGAWHTAISPTVCPLNQWVRLMGEYNGISGYLALFQDNAQIAYNNVGIPNSIPSVTTQKFIGRRWDGAEIIDGVIDEMVVYPYAIGGGLSNNHNSASLNCLTRRESGVWVYQASATKRWDGSQWVTAAVWRWDGTAWV